jgi:regulator of RNase E activity RraA
MYVSWIYSKVAADTTITPQIDTVPAGSIIFISAPTDIPNAVYGGLMTHRARFSGAIGTVVDGNFRDLEEHQKLNYPVSAYTVMEESSDQLD